MDVRHRARAARSALPSGRRGLGGHSNRTLPAARVGAETVDVGEERMSVAAMRYVLRQQSTAGSGVRAGGRCGASRGRNGGVHVSRDPQNRQIVPRSSVSTPRWCPPTAATLLIRPPPSAASASRFANWFAGLGAAPERDGVDHGRSAQQFGRDECARSSTNAAASN